MVKTKESYEELLAKLSKISEIAPILSSHLSKKSLRILKKLGGGGAFEPVKE